MKLNVAQCRSAKKTAAPRGLRRSVRNSSSSASCFSLTQQEKIAEFYAGAHCLPVSTLPSPSKAERRRDFHSRQGKIRQSKKHEVTKKSSLPFQDFEQKQQRSSKLEALVESHLCRKSSFNLENDGILTTMLTKQRSFKKESNVLTKQGSLKQENTGLAKQRSFKLEASNEACINRQTSLKIEALIEPRVLSRTYSCTTIGRKRVVGVDDLSHEIDFPDCNSPSSPSSIWEPEFSPRKKFASPRTPSTCLDRSPSASLTVSELECSPKWNFSVPQTPSTPTASHTSYCLDLGDEEYGGDSQLEELPFDLLLRIVCSLEHDDLRPVSLVCKRLMKAVCIAQRYHFSFTTPHREKKGKSAQLYLSDEGQLTLKGGLAGTFIRPPTPNAPKHSTRPAELRFSHSEVFPFAPRLIQLESPPAAAHTRKSLRMTAGMVTHRVLFDEDELCEAVAQNTL